MPLFLHSEYGCFCHQIIAAEMRLNFDSRRLGVGEQRINFRPSPNFKNMKKFLKYKKDLESSSQSPPNTSSDETPPSNTPDSPNNNQKEKQSPVQQPIQPPLPLDPPPPYRTPLIPIPLKQEIIDDEYPESGQESPNLSSALSDTQTEPPPPETNFENNNEEPDSTSAETCRDFIRGTCVRGKNCRYAHKFDRTQLSNVYTFCKNYQNARCTYPFCRYVHATVFEEQEFYRSGVLPPHAINHRPIFLMPPPPPPPPPPVTETPAKPIVNGTSLQAQTAYKPINSFLPQMESKPADGFKNIMSKVISLKREWSGSNLSAPTRDFENTENSAKKCKHCDNMDIIRLQYYQEKIEDMKRSSLDHKAKTALLSKKSNALFTVLFTVLKSQASSVEGMNGLTATLNNYGEKEKALLHNIMENHRGGSFSNIM